MFWWNIWKLSTCFFDWQESVWQFLHFFKSKQTKLKEDCYVFMNLFSHGKTKFNAVSPAAVALPATLVFSQSWNLEFFWKCFIENFEVFFFQSFFNWTHNVTIPIKPIKIGLEIVWFLITMSVFKSFSGKCPFKKQKNKKIKKNLS